MTLNHSCIPWRLIFYGHRYVGDLNRGLVAGVMCASHYS